MSLGDCRRGVFSQGSQDRILVEMFRHIRPLNDPPFAIECGFNADALEGGSGSNVAVLVREHGWHALLLDGQHENPAINLRREFLTSANVVDVFRRWGVPDRPDYVSIDLDSTDLWVFRTLLSHYRASVYSVEYNAHFPIDAAITFPDDPTARWQGDRGYGASLAALARVACEHGYSLVAVEPGLDAFFVRDELLEDGTGLLAPPLEHWTKATGIACHKPLIDPDRATIFLDYRVWRDTGGDQVAARAAATTMTRRCLCPSVWQVVIQEVTRRCRIPGRRVSRRVDTQAGRG